MKSHFSYGFTITNKDNHRQQEQTPRNQHNHKPSNIINIQQHQSDDDDDMLFKIGSKRIGQERKQQKKRMIEIQESGQSDDSDKTVEMNKVERKHKHKKEKKQKKQKHKHNKKHKEKHKEDEQSVLDELRDLLKNQQMEIEDGEINVDQRSQRDSQREKRKKEKKEKKQKKDMKKQKKQKKQRRDRSAQKKHINEPDKQDYSIKWQNEAKENPKQHSPTQLFPSLLTPSTQLTPFTHSLTIPSTLSTLNTNLSNNYLQKLSQSHLLPSRTIKQLSHSLLPKNEEFSFLYQNDFERFEKESSQEFFVNGKMPDYLRCDLKFDVVRFGTKELYTYGKHMDKEIPKYRLIENYGKVIGVKEKKQHKYEKIMREIYRELNQVQYSAKYNVEKKDKANDDRYFHYQGYELLQTQNLANIRQKLQLLKSRPTSSNLLKSLSPYHGDNSIILFPSQILSNRTTMLQHHLSLLQSQVEEQFKARNKQLTQGLGQAPNDVEAWVKLVQLQDQLRQVGNNKLGNAKNDLSHKNDKLQGFILQKQLSILTRALKANENNELLGVRYFETLFSLLRQQKLQLQKLLNQYQIPSLQSISQQLLKYITTYQTNPSFYLLYLQYRLHIQPTLSLSIYLNHTYVKSLFQEISGMINLYILKEKSAQQIKKLRTISLMLLERILQFYKDEGYQEMCLGVGVALLEFNLCVPETVERKCGRQSEIEEKKKEFKKYWEDYRQEKVGDLVYREKRGWDVWACQRENAELERNTNIVLPLSQTLNTEHTPNATKPKPQQKHPSYITKHFPTPHFPQTQLLSSILHKQLSLQQISWHFANPLYNKSLIRQSIESLVMFEDVEQWLGNFRDSENIVKLLELVFEKGLGMGFGLRDEEDGKVDNMEWSILDSVITGMNRRELQIQANNSFKTVTKNKRHRWNLFLSTNLSQQLFQWPLFLTISLFSNQTSSSTLNCCKKLLYFSRLLRIIANKLIPSLVQQKNYQSIFRLQEKRMHVIQCLKVCRLQILEKFEGKENQEYQDLIELLNVQNMNQEVKELIGWSQPYKSMIGPQYYELQPYHETKLWAMYIHTQLTVAILTSKNTSSQQNLSQKLSQCLNCYKQLILTHYQTLKQERSNHLVKYLQTIRYYCLFLKQVSLLASYNDIDGEINIHVMKVIVTENSDDIIKEIDIFVCDFVNKMSSSKSIQQVTSANTSISPQKNFLSPLKRLQLLTTISQLSQQITVNIKSPHLTNWLSQLSNPFQNQDQIIYKVTQYDKQSMTRKKHVELQCLTQRVKKVIDKFSMVETSLKREQLGEITQRIDKICEMLAVYRYFARKFNDDGNTRSCSNLVVQTYYQILLYELRLLQSNFTSSVNKPQPYYLRQSSFPLSYLLYHFEQLFTRNLSQLKKQIHVSSNNPQNQLKLSIHLSLQLLNYLLHSNIPYRNHLTQLKSTLYHILVKYPQVKIFYIYYLKVIQMENMVKNHDQIKIKEINQQVIEIYNRMKASGVRVFTQLTLNEQYKND